MELPFCKICGERHRLGHCPLWDEPPTIIEKPRPSVAHPAGQTGPRAVNGPQSRPPVLIQGATATQVIVDDPFEAGPQNPGPQEKGTAVAAQDQGRPYEQNPAPAKPAPPLKPYPAPPSPDAKFDKRAYQRELMRKRRSTGEDAPLKDRLLYIEAWGSERG